MQSDLDEYAPQSNARAVGHFSGLLRRNRARRFKCAAFAAWRKRFVAVLPHTPSPAIVPVMPSFTDLAGDLRSEANAPITGAAMTGLVANHRSFLAFLEARVGDRALAEDILQEAFVRGIDRSRASRATNLRSRGSTVCCGTAWRITFADERRTIVSWMHLQMSSKLAFLHRPSFETRLVVA